ncbi:MAG: iron-sulfur cluster assembly accessory protein [Dehalococcoidia bacterium]
MTTKAPPTIYVTEKAVNQTRKLAEKEGLKEYGLRVRVMGGGCSGLSYKLGLDENPGENDRVIEQHGLKIFVDLKSMIHLASTTLDFSDGLNGKGFTFSNPNAKSTCGCGSSFST